MADDTPAPDLFGVISSSDLQNAPYNEWYSTNYSDYQVDQAALASLDNLLDGIEVKIIMGTWCHDSKREVPRFYKILSSLNGASIEDQMIALDREKKAPNGEIDGMGITNTPTFIFYRDGQELNRIVEVPIESLEKDMAKILKGEDYRHSKLP